MIQKNLYDLAYKQIIQQSTPASHINTMTIRSSRESQPIWSRKCCTLFYTHLTYLVSLKAFGISTLTYSGITCRGDAIY